MNKATYLSLKSDFGGEFGLFLKLLHVLGFLERERSKFQRVWEILLCEDLQRTELKEEVVLRAWDEFVSDCEILEVEETSSTLVFLQSFIFLFSLL